MNQNEGNKNHVLVCIKYIFAVTASFFRAEYMCARVMWRPGSTVSVEQCNEKYRLWYIVWEGNLDKIFHTKNNVASFTSSARRTSLTDALLVACGRQCRRCFLPPFCHASHTALDYTPLQYDRMSFCSVQEVISMVISNVRFCAQLFALMVTIFPLHPHPPRPNAAA